MNVSITDIGKIISPLRLIFWGGLLCVFDFRVSQTSSGKGWQFDILNDFAGMLLITWGVFQLARINVHDRYKTAMLFVKVAAALSSFQALHDHFVYPIAPTLSFFLFLSGVVVMIAMVVFCVAMQWLSEEADLLLSARSWKTTTLLFVFIYLIPLGLFYCAGAIAIATGTSFNIDLGPSGLLLIPVFFVPVIHLFISTSRMKNEAVSIPITG